jgi:hypothetical protein
MNLLRSCTTFLAVAFLLAHSPATSLAAFIDGAVTGPGGFGNAGLFGTTNTLVEPSLTYTSVDYLDLSLTVDAAGAYEVAETPAFGSVHNTTGVAWIGFTWEVISGPAVEFLYSPNSPNFSGQDFSNTFPSVTGTATFASFSGGTLASGGFLEPSFRMTIAEPGTIVIRQTPIPVPEPASLVLISIGAFAVGCGWAQRRARQV